MRHTPWSQSRLLSGAEIRRVLQIGDDEMIASLLAANLPETLVSALLGEIALRSRRTRRT